MKKVVLIFGGIAGTISALMFVITLPLYRSGALDMSNGMVIGYTSMIIALSVMFFGIKSYRDNYQHGVITYGQGFKVGILIALIAAVFYAGAWEICLKLLYPDFMEFYSACMVKKAEAKGATAVEMAKLQEDIVWMKEIYKKPIQRFGMTMLEIFPVGLILALVFPAILRKKEVLPA